MTAYQTVVVGTDGSASSLLAVDRASEIASEADAKLIIATGYLTPEDDPRAVDILGEESYKVRGGAPAYAILREARERADAAGATNIEERSIKGAAVEALVDLAREVQADLLVVGNVGLNTRASIIGRVFSIPGSIAVRAGTDILIVHTTG